MPSNYLVDVFKEFNLRADAVPNVVDLSQIRFASEILCGRIWSARVGFIRTTVWT